MKYIVNILDRKVFLHLHFSIWFCVSFAVTKIGFTVNGHRGKVNYPLPLPIGFTTIEACVSATQHIPHFVIKVQ